MPLTIRAARLSDVPNLADYNIRMAMETERIALDPPTVLKGCQAVVDDPSKGLYFVAELEGRVVGQLLITHEWSDWRNGDIWWIQSVYVHPEHRKAGVFKALYRHTQQAAKDAGAIGLRLYVEHENESAQGTYQRLGMSKSCYRVMEELFTTGWKQGR